MGAAALAVIALVTTCEPAPPGPRFRPATVLLGLKEGIPAARGAGLAREVGAREIEVRGAGVHLLRVASGDETRVIQALLARPEVRYAEPDFEHHLDGAPNDPSFNLQWGFRNTGQSVNGTTGTAGADERATAAWGVTTGGPDVVVAVLDSGIEYTHPDLAANMWANPGGVNGCGAGTHGYNVLAASCDPMDDDTAYNGHGTHVAGIIGAVGNNGTGVTGVNWSAELMAVKWVSSTATGFTSDLVSAMDWVINAKAAGVNVRVINDSATWTGTAYSQALSDEIDALTSADILLVTASGNTAQNNDTTPRYPCSYSRPGELCVAATDQTDHLWSSANWGAHTVNLAAPGVSIYSTLRKGSYGYISGGSMACAQVTGAAALLLSQGYQSVATLRASILSSVDKLAALGGLVATGGRLDLCKGISGCVPDAGPPVNLTPPTVGGTAQQGQTLTATAGAWEGAPATYAYQWERCDGSGAGCAPIPNATATSYTILAAADIGATLAVAVTASNASGTATASSAPSAVVVAAPPVSWTVASSITAGQQLCGAVAWQATPSLAASSVSSIAFYVDGALAATATTAPYVDALDLTALAPGAHVFALRAVATDSTVAYASATANDGGGCPGPGSIALVQSTAVQGNNVTALARSFAAPNAAGNLILAFVRLSTTTQTVTVTDTAGNLYSEAAAQAQTADGHQIVLFYAANVAAGANTVTATFSGSNKRPWLAVFEYSGVSTAQPLDRTAQAQGSGTAVRAGPTAPTRSPDELVFAAVGLPGGSNTKVTAGAGDTLLLSNTGSNSPAATEASGVAATGAYAGTFSLSGSANWSALVATFVAAGQAPPPLAITTTSLPDGVAGSPYSATLAATGGTPPYGWAVTTGTLPPGITLAPATGALSGTPTATGSSGFVVQVTDAAAASSSVPLGITVDPPSSVALVQSAAGQGSGVAALAQTFPSAPTAGDLIVAVVRMSTTSQTVTVTDNAGNSYQHAVGQAQTTDGHQTHIFYAAGVAAAPTTVTATFSGSNNHPWLAIYEYRSLSALDQIGQAQGSSSVASCVTGATHTPSELVITGLGLASSSGVTVTAGAGFALVQQDPTPNGSRAASEVQTTTVAGSVTAAFTLSGSALWSCVAATFR
jgi:subtilisin family serine protease